MLCACQQERTQMSGLRSTQVGKQSDAAGVGCAGQAAAGDGWRLLMRCTNSQRSQPAQPAS
jgi:hypothetical protein